MALLIGRRAVIGGAAAAVLGAGGIGGHRWWTKKPPLGMTLDEADMARGRALLAKHPSADAHAHPGRSFIEDANGLAWKLRVYAALGSFEDDTIADMRAGGLTVAGFATVSDFNVLDLSGNGLYAARPFERGEAWQSYRTQIARLKALAATTPLSAVLAPGDITRAKQQGKVGALLATEGTDFLEGRIERVAEAHADGVRSMTVMHYRHNEAGDITTEAPVHNGLTAFGAALIAEMNRLGMIVDLAHASPDTAKRATELSAKPVMISHANISGEGFAHPRFISLDLARQVAQAGGIVGAWPAGILLSSLNDYVDQVFRMADLIGVDHVAVGSDMDGNYKPVYHSYRQLPLLAAALLKRGMAEAEAAKVLGGNFQRVFAAQQT